VLWYWPSFPPGAKGEVVALPDHSDQEWPDGHLSSFWAENTIHVGYESLTRPSAQSKLMLIRCLLAAATSC
jgi:hypothetical protein